MLNIFTDSKFGLFTSTLPNAGGAWEISTLGAHSDVQQAQLIGQNLKSLNSELKCIAKKDILWIWEGLIKKIKFYILIVRVLQFLCKNVSRKFTPQTSAMVQRLALFRIRVKIRSSSTSDHSVGCGCLQPLPIFWRAILQSLCDSETKHSATNTLNSSKTINFISLL